MKFSSILSANCCQVALTVTKSNHGKMSQPGCRDQPLASPLAGSSPVRAQGPSLALRAAALGSAGDVPAPTGPGKAGQKRRLPHRASWGEDGLPESSHGPH